MTDPQLLTSLGAVSAVFFTAAGSAYASAHGGMFAIRNFEFFRLKAFVPMMQAGVLALYGLIVGIMLHRRISYSSAANGSEEAGYRNLASGLIVGAACLCSGLGMGLFLRVENECRKKGVTTTPSPPESVDARQRTGPAEPLLAPPPGVVGPEDGNKHKYIALIVSLVYLEAIGLYGLIVALMIMSDPSKKYGM